MEKYEIEEYPAIKAIQKKDFKTIAQEFSASEVAIYKEYATVLQEKFD